MAWFFSGEEIPSDTYLLSGDNAKHAKVLRLRSGEAVTVVTPQGVQCEGEVASVTPEGVVLNILGKQPCTNEPDVFVTLYQALPKGDKMDYIVQKCVELGVSRIVPVLSVASGRKTPAQKTRALAEDRPAGGNAEPPRYDPGGDGLPESASGGGGDKTERFDRLFL